MNDGRVKPCRACLNSSRRVLLALHHETGKCAAPALQVVLFP
jgi:hypothetical protein